MSPRALTRRRPARRRPDGRAAAGALRTLGLIAVAGSLLSAVLVAAHTDASAAGASAGSRVVSYAGLSVTVPASWPVRDLAADPHTCVRLDQHAVYLGASGTQQDCPAHLVGRTETVQLAPATTTLSTTGVSTAARQIGIAAAGSGVQLTVTWGSDEALARQIAASAVRRYAVQTPIARTPLATAQGTGTPLYPVGATSTRVNGYAFDTCTAPSVAAMKAWRASSYRGVAVYIGGSNRACGDGNLSASWVDSVVNDQHWRLLPIYVGLQAPCSGSRFARVSWSTATAYSQGVADAADAVSDAARFGLAAGTGIYADMEGYGGSSSCAAGVLSYLSGWTSGLHSAGYLAGVYSSETSGIRDLSRSFDDSAYTMPDLVWSARWDDVPTTADPELTGEEFATHQRIKQYRGDHDETWGGVTIDIDSDYADSAASTVGYRATVTQATEARRQPVATAAVLAPVAASATVTATCWLPGTRGGPDWVELTDGSFVPLVFVDLHGQAPPRCGLLYTTWTTANVRTGPGGQWPVVSHIAAGSGGWIVCQAAGDLNRTSTVWDLLRSGLWISDYWMNTPGHSTWSPSLPRC